MKESANDKLERQAQDFYKDTGLLAPFKDAPATGDPSYDYDYRRREYDSWLDGKRIREQDRQALESYGIPDRQSLTNMLISDMGLGCSVDTAKRVIREWLCTVGLPETMNTEETRRLLITLVDEP